MIAVGGVIVGVSALIVIMGVMTGMQTDLRDKILVASPDIRIVSYGRDFMMTDSVWHQALGTVQRDPGVVAASPFVSTVALISAGHDYVNWTQILGIVPGDELGKSLPVTDIRDKATAGDFTFRTPEGGHAGVVLGESLASLLGVGPGDSIQLATMKGERLDPVTGAPTFTLREYLVTGTFRTGLYEYDNNYLVMSLASAQDLAQIGSGVTGLEVRTRSRAAAAPVAARLQDAVGMGLETRDWQSQNAVLFQALSLEKKGMMFILLLIVLVAAFNIVGTLTMVVADKTREIGILRAMGMPARSIRRVFFAQGIIIGMTGTIIGLVIGIVTSVAIDRFKLIPLEPTVYFIDHLPVSTQPLDVLMIVAASLIIAALATIYPARLAALLYPVEAIRHE